MQRKELKKLGKRIFAMVLSSALFMQSMTVSATELEKPVEVVEEVTEEEVVTDAEESSADEATIAEETPEEISTEADVAKTEDASLEEATDDVISTECVYIGKNFELTFKVNEQWEGGYNACVVIKNTTDTVIHDWVLEYNKKYQFNTIWNAKEVDGESKELSYFKNAEWNQDIQPGQTVDFGFQGGENFTGCPTEFDLIGKLAENNKEDYSIEYILDSDWGSGFIGRIVITNLTDKVLEDWVLEFDFDRQINSIWNGVVNTHEGNHYLIKNADYNCNIAPGQTVFFGFLGESKDASVVPSNFNLSTYTPSSLVKIALPVSADKEIKALVGKIKIAVKDDVTNVVTVIPESEYDKDAKEEFVFVKESEIDKNYILIDIEEFYKNLKPSSKDSVFSTKEADIVFVIDGTGSMGTMVNDIKNAIPKFHSEIVANGVIPRYAIIEYGDITDGGGYLKPGQEPTKFYGWFNDDKSFVNELVEQGTPSYYGGDGPETPLDGLYKGMKLEKREQAHQYMILVTDADYHNGIEGNLNYTMADMIEDIVDNGIVTSGVVSRGRDNLYVGLASATKGKITTKLSENNEMNKNLIAHVNNDCWVRLADGKVVKLDKSPKLGDTSVDTDGDGIVDLDELGEMISIQAINPDTMEIEYFEAWTYKSSPIK